MSEDPKKEVKWLLQNMFPTEPVLGESNGQRQGTHHIIHNDKQPVKTTCSLSLDILYVWTVSCQGARVWTLQSSTQKVNRNDPHCFEENTKTNSY